MTESMAGSGRDLIGEVVEDRYLVEEELGAGAMGTVYRARHVRVGRPVAIKVLHDHLVPDATMVERFEREARVAARLHHPNVVAVLDVGTTADGKQLMVLELAEGTCLRDLMVGPMPRERVVHLLAQLLRGLEHAHAAGLVHRDLKPDNVIVEIKHGEWTPRVVDFGIAVLRDGNEARLTRAGFIVGTPQYMAPEQATGQHVDERTDLFALGVMAYELLAGRPPFEGSGVEIALRHIVEDAPPITHVAADPLLEAFARKLMARELTDRFASAKQALDVLALVETDRMAAARVLGVAVPTAEECAATVPQLPVTKRRRVWPALVLLALAIAATWCIA